MRWRGFQGANSTHKRKLIGLLFCGKDQAGKKYGIYVKDRGEDFIWRF